MLRRCSPAQSPMLVHPVGRLQVRSYKVIAITYEPMHFILAAGIHSHPLEERTWHATRISKICRLQNSPQCRPALSGPRSKSKVQSAQSCARSSPKWPRTQGYPRTLRAWTRGLARESGGEVSRSQQLGEHLDRPRTHAALDDSRHEGREGEKGRFPYRLARREPGVTPAPIASASAGPLFQPRRALPVRFSPTKLTVIRATG